MGIDTISNAAEPSSDEEIVVYLGNRQAIEALEDPADIEAAEREERAVNRVRQPLPGKRCTTVVFPPGTTVMEAAYLVTTPARGVWQAHSDADAPAWVASTDPVLAQLLSAHYKCELREPEPDHIPSGDDAPAADDVTPTDEPASAGEEG